ncbi:hypothetical protein CEXT_187631 [Caerostris extrusa]|uniref:Uncharacterized protein n=1 Tax=Caerostris extrusa TaxID=172846 RepID=A0AAV4WWR9_CAEEX|nr:hypothetical protein CEXT_187631 [Caerostris extrusa]
MLKVIAAFRHDLCRGSSMQGRVSPQPRGHMTKVTVMGCETPLVTSCRTHVSPVLTEQDGAIFFLSLWIAYLFFIMEDFESRHVVEQPFFSFSGQ